MAQPTQNNATFVRQRVPYDIPKLILNFPAGLNQNENPDLKEASAGWNFELGARQTELKPRLPFDLIATATNGAPITGICQLVKRDATQSTLVFAGTVCYEWDGTSTGFTSRGTITSGAKMREAYWSLGDYIIMADANSTSHNNVKKWDGTTFSDVLGTFSAKYCVIHLNRAWYFNIWTGGVNYPHMIVVSAFEDPTTVDTTKRGGATTVGGYAFTTGLEAFYLLSPDLKEINEVSVFQNVLILSTKDGQLFKLTGTNSKDFQFTPFYVGSSAVGTESMANIGNDVVYVNKSGNINLLRAVQEYGDVSSSDVARWIKNHVKNLTNAIIVYEQFSQKVYFFVANKVLVLYKDILYATMAESADNAGLSPWSVYVTDHSSQFNTLSAKYMYIPGTTNFTTYWGDSTGNIYDMNGVGNGDAGTYSINLSRTTRVIDMTVIAPFPWAGDILMGKVMYHRDSAPTSLNISFAWSDEYNTSISSVLLKGPPTNNNGACWNRSSYWNGSSYWSQGFQFSDVISHQTFSPTGKGSGFYLTIGTQGVNTWRVDQLELY